jgi:hypothetical protein
MAVSISDEDLMNLPEDPEEAFVMFERLARENLDEDLVENPEESISAKRDYMSAVLAAAKIFEIAELSQWDMPRVGDDPWQVYDQFLSDVGLCVNKLRLLRVKRVKQYSVALNAAAKKKLHHYLDQMRETIEKLEVSVAKKDRLLKKISALALEIDRERTGYRAFADLVIEAADDAGEAAKRLEPVVRLTERIGAALGIAKRAEETRALPAPEERKRIEPPKAEKLPDFSRKKSPPRGGSFAKELDDEIPF